METEEDLLIYSSKRNFVRFIIELSIFFMLLIFIHETGHLVVYDLTHWDDVLNGLGATYNFVLPLGFFVWYPSLQDSYTPVVTSGGFLLTLLLLPLYRRMNTSAKTTFLLFLSYGALESIFQVNLFPGNLGALSWATIFLVVLYLSGVLVWSNKFLDECPRCGSLLSKWTSFKDYKQYRLCLHLNNTKCLYFETRVKPRNFRATLRYFVQKLRYKPTTEVRPQTWDDQVTEILIQEEFEEDYRSTKSCKTCYYRTYYWKVGDTDYVRCSHPRNLQKHHASSVFMKSMLNLPCWRLRLSWRNHDEK